jgi:hypothetical protein
VDEGRRARELALGFRVPAPEAIRGAGGTDGELLIEEEGTGEDELAGDGKIVPFPSSARRLGGSE